MPSTGRAFRGRGGCDTAHGGNHRRKLMHRANAGLDVVTQLSVMAAFFVRRLKISDERAHGVDEAGAGAVIKIAAVRKRLHDIARIGVDRGAEAGAQRGQ